MDLSKLTPNLWTYQLHGPDREFVEFAAKAFDVMMRRGWSAISPGPLDDGEWWIGNIDIVGRGVKQGVNGPLLGMQKWHDPFTALVEADKWYRENVETKGGAS
jgi:hypothetical protein